MKKKLLAFLTISVMSVSLMACGSGSTSAESTAESVVSEVAEVASEVESVPEEAEESEVSVAESVAEVETDAADSAAAGLTTKTETATLEGDIINFDNMSFAVNGKVYTLGQTTLQEMIDDGVPFNSEDLNNANNNLNSNTQSQGFRIELGEYWTAQVYVLNYSDEGKPINELAINELYLPVHQDETQDILTFTFPLNITEEELLAQAGEPDDLYEYVSEDGTYTSNDYTYSKESTMYYRDMEYKFEYANGELEYLYMEWMP